MTPIHKQIAAVRSFVEDMELDDMPEQAATLAALRDVVAVLEQRQTERARLIAALREPSKDLLDFVQTAEYAEPMKDYHTMLRAGLRACADWLEKTHAKAT